VSSHFPSRCAKRLVDRYPGKADYLEQVKRETQSLIDAGYLLPEDLERIFVQSARRWDLFVAVPSAAAAN
jgi:alpha/beta hydrolase family protein